MVGMVGSWRRLKDVHVCLFSGLFLWLCSPRGPSSWLESFCVKVRPPPRIYCFFRESDALVLRATRWHHETLNVRLPAEPRCSETSVGRAISSLPGDRVGTRANRCCNTASSAENSVLAVHLGCRHCSARRPPLPRPPLHWPETPPEASEAPRSQLLPLLARPRWRAGDPWAYSSGQSLRGRGISRGGKTRLNTG